MLTWFDSAFSRSVVAMATAMFLTAACGGGGGGTEPPQAYTIGGTISGLTGSGLVMTNMGGNDLPVSAGATSFVFPGSVQSGTPYNVSVKAQPTGPSQNCTTSNASGMVSGNVQMAVSCVVNSFAVGGTVSGLTGNGLTLQLNGGAPLSLAAGSGGFAFQNVPSGTSYTITVGTQPTNPAQTCTVTNGTGTVGASNVANVNVSCVTTSFTIGGAVAGLAGAGLVLQNNGGNDLAVPAGSTTFAFAASVNAGASYNVTVKTQPTTPSQTCTIANGTGTANANVTSVVVNCVTNSFTIGGTVAGLTAAGLSLLLNGGSPLAVAAGATTFTFPGTVAPGSGYSVTVGSHPAGQTCSVANGTGTVGAGNVTNVAVTCTNNPAGTWTVGGTITGLTATGLVLRLNGGSDLLVPAGATSFTFPAVPSGTNYAVTIGTQPADQNCTVANGSGTVGSANVTNVGVNCAAARYTVGGTITGYVGTGLSLLLNGGARVTLPSGATTFTFLGTYTTGTAYTATVSIQPSTPAQQCTITNATGVVGAANVTNIQVNCVVVYTIGGSITNQLANGLVLLLNGGSPITRNVGQTGFTFPGVPAGTPYTVSVGTQPTAPNQTCTVDTGASGTVGSSNVTNVVVVCRTFGGLTIGGSISGYTGTGLTLRINGGPPVTPQSQGKFTFPDVYQQGDDFRVVIASQPTGPTQSCTLIRGAGAVPVSSPPQAVGNIQVNCSTNATSPLAGTYSVMLNGRRNLFTFWADGTYAFASRLDDASCGPTTGNGVEYGVYNWNAGTGAFTIVTGPVDTNGGCGVWDNSVTPQQGLTGTLVRSGNTLTLTTSDGTFVLDAVASPASTVVGSWGAGPTALDGSFLVLLPDNTFLIVQTQAGTGSGALGLLIGYERGCYSSTSSTVTLDLSASCQPDGFPAIDTNGTAGASGGSLNVPLPYVITGPNTVTIGGDTFLVRILPN